MNGPLVSDQVAADQIFFKFGCLLMRRRVGIRVVHLTSDWPSAKILIMKTQFFGFSENLLGED